MRQAELLEIISNGESSKVEFKTDDVHPTVLSEEIVAFANFEGGTILIGVDDSGELKGCTRADIEEFVVNICRNNVRPSIIPIIEKITVDKKNIVAVSIPRGETAYSTNRGLYYIRVGSTKQVPTQQELLRLFQKRNMLQFDETPVIKASVNSIDKEKVDSYLAELGQSPLNDKDDKALERELINLSILLDVDNTLYPSLGGILAFGKKPQKYFPSYNIQCGAYKGENFLSDTVREKDLKGTLDELIEDAVAFLKLTMPQNQILERGIKRKDEYLYPVEALREGIVNAVSHRDYTISGTAVRLFLFSNRLEIRSPGGLSNTLTLENIQYRQFTRNQMIASFLAGYGYMERRGKGILRMIKLCEQNSIKCELSLTPDNSEFVVTYRPA
jgi:ATP-dependent DNA helicase RecG